MRWSDLRALNGSQRKGFEELCAQLARLESPAGAEFVRKGSPDGGVECFCKLESGHEWGWQAKFFRSSLGDSQWSQLDRSVKTALEAHPSLVRYFVCVPRDRSDSRKPGAKTEMQRWERHVSTWKGWALQHGMEVEFVWWGSSELTSLLSLDHHAGRLRFWFGTAGQFSGEWFDKHLKRAVEVAGPRYSPEVHVDVPVVEDFELFGRSESAVAAVRDVAKGIRQTRSYTLRRLASEEAPDAMPELGGVAESVDEVVEMLYGMRCVAHEQWPFSEVVAGIDAALGRLSGCVAALSVAADEFKERPESEDASYIGRTNPYREAAREVRALQDALWHASTTLARFERPANSDLLLITGEAGSGKTHLLCDVATRRLAEQSPTVVLMGQQFTTSDLPWAQARTQLDLLDLSVEEFVGALEAAAQAAGTRVLFMIDAINEGEGYAIWPAHLTDLLTHLRTSPWIGVVLSVRTPYVDHIVPAPVRESACEVTHHGFADDRYAAVDRFCQHYGLDFPATPLLRSEFGNPLFLKTLCEGLQQRGERRIPVGSEGITAVFERHLGGIDAALARERDHDPQDRIVARALDAVASELAERGTRWLPRQRAKDLVDALSPAVGFRDSLSHALVNAGLLIEYPGSDSGDEPVVALAYDWFADYLIAKHLIARCGDAQGLASTLTGDAPDGKTAAWRLRSAPLEALSVLLPERLGIELSELFIGHGTGSGIRSAFLKGLPWRDPSTIGPACCELIDGLLATAQHSGTVDVFDSLMACAIVPDHPIGAAFLDERLRDLEMPDRDAVWSQYLYLAYKRDGPVDCLLDWAEKHSERTAALDYDTAAACATVLAWCLSASHRFVRDRATKGLVAVLINNISLTCELVERFNDVDDPYVRERVIAAAYGVAMHSTDAEALAPLADAVYRLIFAGGEPPAHILLRDYARGVIERALYLGANITIDAKLIEPPYRSRWPHIPDDSEMETLDPPIEQDQRELSEAEWAPRRIASSVMRGDFGRYVIGTNSSSASNSWLSIPTADPPWQSPKERTKAFRRSLDPGLQETFNELWTRPRAAERFASFIASDPQPGSGATEESALPYTIPDSYLDTELEESFVAALSAEQEAAYKEIKEARGSKEPRLNLDIIQRYVLRRVFELGWTTDRFCEPERRISDSNSYARYHDTRKPERIGKKYQWIAYHEILAYISDHYQYWVPYDDVVPKDEYRGAWQLSVRDIDPSAVSAKVAPRREQPERSARWWCHDAAIASVDDVDHEKWLRCETDIPDRDQQLRFTNPDNGDNWIKLHGMDKWQSRIPFGYDRHEIDHREVWFYACGYLVDVSDVQEFIAWSETVDFWGRWMPESSGFHSLFCGEFGWSFAFKAVFGDFLEPQHPTPREGAQCPIPLRPAAFEYVAESSEYDCSRVEGAALYRPNPELVETLNLRWTGHGADFVDTEGTCVAFDPSAHDTCQAALLVSEKSLASFLNETGSALVWAIIGEKRAIRPRGLRDPWAGFLEFTDASVYEPGRLTGHLATRLVIVDRDR